MATSLPKEAQICVSSPHPSPEFQIPTISCLLDVSRWHPKVNMTRQPSFCPQVTTLPKFSLYEQAHGPTNSRLSWKSSLTSASLFPTTWMPTVPCPHPPGQHHSGPADPHVSRLRASTCRPQHWGAQCRCSPWPVTHRNWTMSTSFPALRRDTWEPRSPLSLGDPGGAEPHVSTAVTCS